MLLETLQSGSYILQSRYWVQSCIGNHMLFSLVLKDILAQVFVKTFWSLFINMQPSILNTYGLL